MLSKLSLPLVKCLLFAAFVVGLDQLSKAITRSSLEIGESVTVVSGILNFTHATNEGAAWGMLGGQRWLLVFAAIVVSGFVIHAIREYAERSPSLGVGLSLILGGAIGNLIDRIVFSYVTDFIDVETPIEILRTFPIFNLADSALTVGVAIIFIVSLFGRGLPDLE